MRIISFAWTTDAFLAGRKTCTCRNWKADYAARFKAGDLVAAYDRSPQYKGRQIGTIRLTHDATYGNLFEALGGFDAVYEAEGFAWYDEQAALGNTAIRKSAERGLQLDPGETLRDYLKEQFEDGGAWGEWIVRFEVVELIPRPVPAPQPQRSLFDV